MFDFIGQGLGGGFWYVLHFFLLMVRVVVATAARSTSAHIMGVQENTHSHRSQEKKKSKKTSASLSGARHRRLNAEYEMQYIQWIVIVIILELKMDASVVIAVINRETAGNRRHQMVRRRYSILLKAFTSLQR